MHVESRKFIRYPALWLAIAMACGILAGPHLNGTVWVTTTVGSAFAALAFIRRGTPSGRMSLAIFFACVGLLCFEVETLRENSFDRVRTLYDSGTLTSGSPVEVEGILAAAPEESLDGRFLNLSVGALTVNGESRDARGIVRIFAPASANGIDPYLGSDISEMKYGSHIRVSCNLGRADEYLDPGVQTTREALDRIGVDASCTLKSALLIEHLADEGVFLPLARVYDARGRLVEAFREHLDQRTAGVMIASLLGNKYFLDKDTADLFREGGTFHILVISGLHITFIGGLLLWIVRRVTRRRWVQFAVTAGVLWSYTVAVGGGVPVVRASVMFTIFLLGYALNRQGNLLNSLGVCALLLLAWRPSELFNPSFQLTFVAVVAIVACAYPLIEKLRWMGAWSPTASAPFPPRAPRLLIRLCETLYWNDAAWRIEQRRNVWTANIAKSPLAGGRLRFWSQTLARYLFEALVVSAIVQLWMLPLSVWYFHRVSFAGVLLNIWVGGWIAVESFAAVAGAMAGGGVSDLLASGFYAIAGAANSVLLLLPRIFADNGWASFRLPAYRGAAASLYAIYFVPLLLLVVAVQRWDIFDLSDGTRPKRWPLVLPVAAAFVLPTIVIGHPFSAPSADGKLHIDFLDVGQGDSIFVTFPGGETLLIDGGGRPDHRARDADEEPEDLRPDRRTVGESIVSEVLWYKGYSHVDQILATHADADHIQGLGDVARNFSVGSALFGRTPSGDPEFAELRDVLEKRRVPVDVVSRGETFNTGGAVVEVLYPIETEDPSAPSDNDHSVVVRITYGKRSFLLTGDIERAAETELTFNGGTLGSDVVKVPHHGSRTSSTAEFIAATHPRYAIISVGRHSPFGHPHQDVVERWQAAGVRVLTTGENGMISVATDGRNLEVTRYIPE